MHKSYSTLSIVDLNHIKVFKSSMLNGYVKYTCVYMYVIKNNIIHIVTH